MGFTSRYQALLVTAVLVFATLVVSGGAASGSTPASVPGRPAAPLASAGRESATVTWTAPKNGGSPITSYTVTATPQQTTCTWTGGPLTCTLSGIHDGTPHTFTVRAHNKVGTGPTSKPSKPVTAVAPPSKPNTVWATAGSSSALVSWSLATYSGGTTDAYVVTASPGGRLCTVYGDDPTSCTVTGLTNNTTYTFTVRASNYSGNGPPSTPSNPVTPVLGGKPGTPGTPGASPFPQGAAIIWTAPPTGGRTITEYIVKTTPTSGNTSQCVWSSGPLVCDVTGLTNGRSYSFTVQAINPAGPGPVSSTSNVVAVAGPPSKPGTAIAGSGIGDAEVEWTPPAFTGGSPITEYVVTSLDTTEINPTVTTCTWSPSDGPTLACTVPDLVSGGRYRFVVRAYNAFGGGAISTPTNAVIIGGS